MELRHKEIKLTQDLVAKKILRNTRLTAQLIKDILDIPVKTVKLLDGVQIKFIPTEDILIYNTSVDVLAELDDDTQVIIEIQVMKQDGFEKRLWTYMCNQVSQNADELKKRGVRTHSIYSHMIPVYAIAITEKSYFEDNRALRVIGFCDLESKEEFKVEIEDVKEKRNLMLMAFLELEKYDSHSMENYQKVRWLEFFGNKPFTQKPDELILAADQDLDYKTWSKEEKEMYNESIRQQDAYNASMDYVEKQGIEKGIEKGRIEGEISAFVKMVRNGYLTKEKAAEGLGISVEEFEKYL